MARASFSPGEEPRSISALVFLLLIAIGVILLLGAGELRGVWNDLTKELGIVLISVFGVSLIYEHLLADAHFRRSYRQFEQLIRSAENNSARCASLGIQEIHENRQSYDNAFQHALEGCGPGCRVRIVGRSLIFSMYGWEKHLKRLVEDGAAVELCFFDPAIEDTPLRDLAAYYPSETSIALEIFNKEAKPWLEQNKPKGSLEIRFHEVHLMDSCFEVLDGARHWIAWDMNFGRGLNDRRIFVVRGKSPFGENLSKCRYDILWAKSKKHYKYQRI